MEVKVSLSGHITLNWRKNKQYDRYLAEEDADGTITLIPASLVPAILRKDPAPGHGVMEAIREFGLPERSQHERL